MTPIAPFTTKERELVRASVLRGEGYLEVFYPGDGVWSAEVLTSGGHVYVEAPSAADVLRKIADALEES